MMAEETTTQIIGITCSNPWIGLRIPPPMGSKE